MKRFSQQLKKKSAHIRLSAAEKRDVRERLVAYMEYHPMSVSDKPVANQIASEPFRIWRFNTPQLRAGVGVFAALVFIIVPVVAERSVPGDVLYPVKVQFNEEVRSTLTLSPYEKVEWETERLERRIAEARLLADEGKLTDEVRAEVAEAVKEHTDAAQAEIASIRETDRDEAAIVGIAFTSALEVQSEVLEQDRVAAGDTAEDDVLAVAVETARADAQAAQADEQPSYQKLVARIESETTRAQEFLNSLEDVISEADRAEVERRLSDIAVKVTAATADYDPENESASDESVDQLSEVLADVRKLISFMTGIDVKETVEVEDLVPVTLTLDERLANVAAALDVIAVDVTQVESLLPQITDSSLAEKIVFGLSTVQENIAVIEADLATGTVAAAEPAVVESQALLKDMLFTLALEEVDRVPEVPVEVISTSIAPVASSTEEVIVEPEPETTEPEDENEALGETAEPVEEVATSTEAVDDETTE